jgi:serine/threonine protein kinase
MMATAVPSSSVGTKSEFLVNGKYRLIRKIGSGSFGDIYLGINVSNGEVGWHDATFTFINYSKNSHV